jgi:4-hydroxy-tetrahydrodipicolinate reductase
VTRLAIIGDGKMGKAIRELAGDAGFNVVAFLGEHDVPASGPTKESLKGADVAIEFTVPAAAAANVLGCAKAGVAVISGTTGWESSYAATEQAVRALGGAMLWSPNFSIGVQLFARIVERAAAEFGAAGRGFSTSMVETHHTEKKDAPSGTAKMLASRMRASVGDIPIRSERVGKVPGTHEITFDSAFEQVRLVHEAKDRRVFAAGALAAARWIVGKQGIFTMDDFLGVR